MGVWQVIKIFNKYKMITDNQFGFRNNHSTNMALLIMLENIRIALENGECAIGIVRDFQKEFVTVDHDILSKNFFMVSVEFPGSGFIVTYLIDIRLLNVIIMNQSLVK